MFDQIDLLGPESKVAKELRLSSVNLFNRIPGNSSDRNRAKIYERYRKKIRDGVLSRADDLMDALTDLVKDFPSEKEIKKAGDLLKEVLKGKEGEDLAGQLTMIESSLTQQEKNAVFRDELKQLKNTLDDVISELVKLNWSEVSEEESEKLYAFSEAITTCSALVDSLLRQLSIDGSADIKQGIVVLLYLSIRANAYLLGKISHESLSMTISAIEAYAYSNADYLLINRG
jgi:hypothetical protein